MRKHGIFSFLAAVATLLASVLAPFSGAVAAEAMELRVLTHSSFALPKPLLAQFEKDTGAKLRIAKGGDGGEMLNKLILTRANPIADVVFGIDNSLAPKALAAGVLEAGAAMPADARTTVALPAPLVAVDYGYVTVNYDKAWFAKSGLALPKSLDELARPEYAKLLVVQNPATSSPGRAFLLATIGALGEDKAFDWWASMRSGGMKVAKGWTEAYYTEFSLYGGKYPLVVSYATSPAAEVFFAKVKPNEPPTGSLVLPGGVYRQVEGVALVKGGGQRALAEKFIAFLRSTPVQEQLQTEMWMYPAVSGTARAAVMKFAPEPTTFAAPADLDLSRKDAQWVERWGRVVLK
jgi:thiamine transport system substrate-binding protein